MYFRRGSLIPASRWAVQVSHAGRMLQRQTAARKPALRPKFHAPFPHSLEACLYVWSLYPSKNNFRLSESLSSMDQSHSYQHPTKKIGRRKKKKIFGRHCQRRNSGHAWESRGVSGRVGRCRRSCHKDTGSLSPAPRPAASPSPGGPARRYPAAPRHTFGTPSVPTAVPCGPPTVPSPVPSGTPRRGGAAAPG